MKCLRQVVTVLPVLKLVHTTNSISLQSLTWLYQWVSDYNLMFQNTKG